MNFIRMIQPRGSWPQFSQTLCFCTRLVRFGTQVQVALPGHYLSRWLGKKDFCGRERHLMCVCFGICFFGG